MKRNEWSFEYTAATLAKAAEKKRDEHESKMNWWAAKETEVMARIKESGIEIHDSVAAGYGSAKTAGFSPEVTIDGTMQRDLTECRQKVQANHKLAESYGGWVQVLTAAPEKRVELHHDDWLFFFGA